MSRHAIFHVMYCQGDMVLLSDMFMEHQMNYDYMACYSDSHSL